MTLEKRILVWGLLVVGGLVLIGLGVFFGVTRLDDADKWGSVIGAGVALLGLPAMVYGVVLARRDPSRGSGGQSVAGSTIAGRLVQVRNVRGDLRIGPPVSGAPPARTALRVPPPASAMPPALDGQSITRSRIAGPVHQADGVGGDADIDR